MEKKRTSSQSRGFSLVETALVLVVAGTILGGIWFAAARAMTNAKVQHAVEAIGITVANTRNFYAGQTMTPASTDVTMTTQLLMANVIAPELLRPMPNMTCTNAPSGLTAGMCADTPFGSYDTTAGTPDPGGTFRVCTWNLGTDTKCDSGTHSPFFAVELMGLTFQNCVALVEAVSAPSGPGGLVEININGTNLLETSKPIQPVAIGDANANCTAAGGSGFSTAVFIYRLTAAAQ